MQLYSLVLTAGTIYSAVLIASIVIPSNFNTLCMKTIQTVKPSRKSKKQHNTQKENIIVLQQGLDSCLEECIIPFIENISSMKVDLITNQLGQYKPQAYFNAIEMSPMLLVFITEEVIDDPWFLYALSLCLNNKCQMIVCYDQDVSLSKLPGHLRDLCVIGRVKFKRNNAGHIENPEQFSKYIERLFVNNNSDLIPLPSTTTSDICCPYDTTSDTTDIWCRYNATSDTTDIWCRYNATSDTPDIWCPYDTTSDTSDIWCPYDVCFIHETSDLIMSDLICTQLEENHKLKVYDTKRDSPCGQYKFLSIYNAIKHSRFVMFLITPELVSSPLFEYQMQMALLKGHRSIILVLTNENAGLLYQHPRAKQVYAQCKKVYISNRQIFDLYKQRHITNLDNQLQITDLDNQLQISDLDNKLYTSH